MTDREAFEAWLAPKKGQICPPHPEDYWMVWQAALASERQKQCSHAWIRYDEFEQCRYCRQKQAEPVAWRWRSKAQDKAQWALTSALVHGDYEVQPLYAAPPVDPAKREQVAECVNMLEGAAENLPAPVYAWQLREAAALLREAYL